MTTYIAILRGINVGGKRKLLMKDLKELLIQMGFSKPQTYIQSGNVAFGSDTRKSVTQISSDLEKAIAESFGYEVPVIIREAEEIEKIIESNPFLHTDTEIQGLHLSFLNEIPAAEDVKRLCSDYSGPDKFELRDNNIFILCSGRYSESKLTNQFFEKRLKVKATTRNWKTVLKLKELAEKV